MINLFRLSSIAITVVSSTCRASWCAIGLVVWCLLVVSTSVRAHSSLEGTAASLAGAPRERLLGMSAAIVARTGSTPASSTRPGGLLVSDEASYGDNGLLLQAWSGSLLQPLSPASWVSVGVGTHAGHGSESEHESSIEVETLSLSHHRQSGEGRAWVFTLGKQSQAPQSWLNWHADEGVESVPSLLADVFMAGHRVDTGASANVLLGSTELGVNLWNGDAWPATGGEGMIDLLAKHRRALGKITVDSGLFVSAAQSVERGADDSAHSHDDTSSSPAFTGDSTLGGGSLTAFSEPHARYQWSAQIAWLVSHESGDLILDAQQAGLRSDAQGMRLHAQLERAGRGVWLRHEWLAIDNRLQGAGGQAMAEAAGIATVQGNPARTVLGGWWQVLPTLRWQLALQREHDGSAEAWRGWLALQWGQQWPR